MSVVQTLFHELLHTLHSTLPDGTRERLYYKILLVTRKHGIGLQFLVGEDPEFDAAFEKLETDV